MANRNEAFFSNPSFISSRNDTGYGADKFASEKLGKSSFFSLQRGFSSSPILNNVYKIEDAAAEFSSYNGENTSYGLEMYRRNFTPDSNAGAAYENPRNKDISTGIKGAPGTPFSPNLASPSYEQIETGEITHTTPENIDKLVTGFNNQFVANKLEILNPVSNLYSSVDSENRNQNVGSVRRFVLGVGSKTKII